MSNRLTAFILVTIVTSACAEPASATIYHLEGQGTLTGPNPAFGVIGENVTISIDLDSAAWFYFSTPADPKLHYFVPVGNVPLIAVGATSGLFPDVDPVQRFVAYEGNSDLGHDFLSLDNGTPTMLVTVVRLDSVPPEGFDGALGPFTPADAFSLLKSAIDNPSGWETSVVNFFIGGAEDIILLGDIRWTITEVPEPSSIVLTLMALLAALGIAGVRRTRSSSVRKSTC